MKDNNTIITKTYLILATLFVTCILVSNTVSGNIINFFSIGLPAGVVVFPLMYIIGDVLTEVYGFKRAKFVIWIGFLCNLIAVGFYMLVLILPNPDFFTNADAYKIVLGTTPLILLASLVGYLAGSFTNSIVMSSLKVKTKGKHLWLRTILSTIVGEALDTVLFIGIAFTAIFEFNVVLQLMLFQFLFKVSYEILFTPVTYWVVKKIKKIDNADTYDINMKYSLIK